MLDLQYVTNGEHVWQVNRGSGMGARHSSGLADLAFYHIAEKGLDWKEHGIIEYLRLRDDLCAIARDDQAATWLVSEIARRAFVCWRVTFDAKSKVGIQMLDLYLYKGPHFMLTGVLDHSPF